MFTRPGEPRAQRRDDNVTVIRRNRQERATAPEPPDPALMTLVETTGAKARAATSLHEAISIVLEDVEVTAGWAAAHAWVPGEQHGTWVSSGIWHPVDGIGLGGLRHACVETSPITARGHLALALHMESTKWVEDLGGLTGTPIHEAATAAGVVSAIACPVYAGGRAVAILEWYLSTGRPPSADVPHVLSHLSGVLSEVAERPVRTAPSQGRNAGIGEILRWVTEDGVMSRLLTTC
jgi:hypothetical protein